jgi:hypothetical protein
MFDSFEKAEDLIDRMGLSGAFAVEVDDSGEEAVERYGGQEDLW